MNPELAERIAALAADRQSGASEILERAIAILRDAEAAGANMRVVGWSLRAAQPSMAGVLNATLAALAGDLDRFAARTARAPEAIARIAGDLLETGLPPDAPLIVVTLSYSGTVARTLERLAERREVNVCCSESRPTLEGKRLATRLIAAGVGVQYYLDAALGQAVKSADAVLIGADAVTPEWFINKIGTRSLAATAVQGGIPVYVVAGREKFVRPDSVLQITVRSGPPAEVWDGVPEGIVVWNPYFEACPVELATAFVTDIGLIGSADVASVCRSAVIY